MQAMELDIAKIVSAIEPLGELVMLENQVSPLVYMPPLERTSHKAKIEASFCELSAVADTITQIQTELANVQREFAKKSDIYHKALCIADAIRDTSRHI